LAKVGLNHKLENLITSIVERDTLVKKSDKIYKNKKTTKFDYYIYPSHGWNYCKNDDSKNMYNFIFHFGFALFCIGLMIMERWKIRLNLWKVSSIWMKLLNDIACNFHGNLIQIQVQLNWIHDIQLKRNKLQNVV
jgi:hypothetical protein